MYVILNFWRCCTSWRVFSIGLQVREKCRNYRNIAPTSAAPLPLNTLVVPFLTLNLQRGAVIRRIERPKLFFSGVFQKRDKPTCMPPNALQKQPRQNTVNVYYIIIVDSTGTGPFHGKSSQVEKNILSNSAMKTSIYYFCIAYLIIFVRLQ